MKCSLSPVCWNPELRVLHRKAKIHSWLCCPLPEARSYSYSEGNVCHIQRRNIILIFESMCTSEWTFALFFKIRKSLKSQIFFFTEYWQYPSYFVSAYQVWIQYDKYLLLLINKSIQCHVNFHTFRYVTTCAFAPRRLLLATGSMDKTVHIWQLDNKKPCAGQCLKDF